MKAYTQIINEYCQGPLIHQLDWQTGRVDGDTEVNQRWWSHLFIDGVLRGESIDLPRKQDAKEAAAQQAVSALGLWHS